MYIDNIAIIDYCIVIDSFFTSKKKNSYKIIQLHIGADNVYYAIDKTKYLILFQKMWKKFYAFRKKKILFKKKSSNYLLLELRGYVIR
jgi:hypothetical protein